MHGQSSLAVTIILVPGVALGVVVGRRVVALLMDSLGIVPGADVRALGIAAIVGAALLLANALALPPASHAARVGVVELTAGR